MEPIVRLTFEAEHLMHAHPPLLRDANKQRVFELACPPGTEHGGTVGYSRWLSLPLPDTFDAAVPLPRLDIRIGYYDYRAEWPGAIEWHVNFADAQLFVAYGSSLFAQDEVMCAEHPALGALREALVARGEAAITVDGSVPTPVLVTGVERHCAIDLEGGLYGRAFAHATPGVLERAVTRLRPVTRSNILAMQAPAHGHGRYSRATLSAALVTAYTGFRAAHEESARLTHGAPRPVVVHTGWWGCGVYGGHRTMMAMIQLLAARLAGLDGVVFHHGEVAARAVLDEAVERAEALCQARHGGAGAALLHELERLGMRWGVGDGN